jgi:hypothetical protein
MPSPLAAEAAAAPAAPPELRGQVRPAWRAGQEAPSFYDWRSVFPFLAELAGAAAVLRDELRAAGCLDGADDEATAGAGGAGAAGADGADRAGGADGAGGADVAGASGTAAGRAAGSSWRDWPETALYHKEGGMDWKVVPLCYSFPADDARHTVWVGANAERFPRTAALLRRVPGLRTALFSRLGPRTTLSPHQGWAQLSNHVLRLHLGLVVPGASDGGECGKCSGGGDCSGDGDCGGGGIGRGDLPPSPPPCGVVVGDEIRFHAEGELLCFDDSLLHSAFNLSARPRVVLIFDVARPDGCAPGSAAKGNTVELEEFIRSFH